MNTHPGTAPHIHPGTKIHLPLGAWLLITLSTATSIGSAIGAYSTLNHKIHAIERRVETLENEFKVDSKLLHRMDERLDSMQGTLGDIRAQLNKTP